MIGSTRLWIAAVAVALYLYFLLPATAVIFYELYHLTGIEPVYWGYSAFKFAGYYFSIWPYQLLACVLAALAIVLVPTGIRKLRGR
jgi:hypothetical protein